MILMNTTKKPEWFRGNQVEWERAQAAALAAAKARPFQIDWRPSSTPKR